MSQDKEENHLIEERRKKLAELREANKLFQMISKENI